MREIRGCVGFVVEIKAMPLSTAELKLGHTFPQALLRHRNGIVEVYRAWGLHAVLLVQNDFLVHREMARREWWK
jgi:hypothetical protein